MSDFTVLAPGNVRHADGWTVRNAGRCLVEYEDEGQLAALDVERGTSSNTIYPDTLRWVGRDDQPPTDDERTIISARIELRLRVISGKEIERAVGPGLAHAGKGAVRRGHARQTDVLSHKGAAIEILS